MTLKGSKKYGVNLKHYNNGYFATKTRLIHVIIAWKKFGKV